MKSISVRRVKGGRTGTVEFQGGETLALDGGIERFDELLALISSTDVVTDHKASLGHVDKGMPDLNIREYFVRVK